ncbi:hypothetical protein [Amycolatopsis sp. PS_44_ISF1]|uniref:hypothetical protein n=1 Tax=Amycolatopsis sp. PS_44_ISF1 TaxID=2974917 RepID=UPI0028DD4E9D|nr:hypothetical protein [Amycolatopsis sp. PS_44_ISF1]MDT8912083.1 hypothetical protein [Amycolatopsis sp. PS_44_ISF1]
MSLLTRLRRMGHPAANGFVTEVGDVLVVRAAGDGTAGARELAATLPADPGHQVVVADLPPGAPIESWESFAAALPRDRRPLRLVPGRRPLEIGQPVPPWLARRLGRPVLAPFGRVWPGAGGALFVHSGPRTGWGWFRPGQPATWAAKRFPAPGWESSALAEVVAAGSDAVAEPLPAGMWIRPKGPDARFARERLALIGMVPARPGTPVLVVGSAEVPGLAPSTIAAFWRTLPPEIRGAAWFAVHGGLALPRDRSAGAVLAAAIDSEVLCCNGIPVGSPDRPQAIVPQADGGPGRADFVRVFAYRPGEARPRLRAQHAPLGDLPEIVPGAYRYAADVAVEVIQAGLWVRPVEGERAGGSSDAIRAVPQDPASTLVLYDGAGSAKPGRLRTVAEDLVRTLELNARIPARAHSFDSLSAVAEHTSCLPVTPVSAEGRAEATAKLRVLAPAPSEPMASVAREVDPDGRTARIHVRSVPAADPPGEQPGPAEPTIRMATQPKPADAGAGNGEPEPPSAGGGETALPYLSRMMETMALPVPAALRSAAADLSAPLSQLSARLEGKLR